MPKSEWEVSPAEAVARQRELAGSIVQSDGLMRPPRTVAGVDVGLVAGRARAAVVVLAFPQLGLIESVMADVPLVFPYVPGLLSFREGPAVLAAVGKLEHLPDLLLFDGQGYAHPRRMGLATHLGILLDCPAIGCAKSCLCGTYQEPGWERGSSSPLMDGEEVIGAVVRTRSRVRPLFISVGHRVSLATAVELVLQCGAGYRLPEPTRRAHLLASYKETT